MKHLRRAASALGRSSPPMRGRGLKLQDGVVELPGFGSPPMRGRGLKPQIETGRVALTRRPPCGGAD